ncbi:antirepressor, partial [Clostridium botulinum]
YGVLMSNNTPYQRFVDNKYFKIIEKEFEKPNGEIKINTKTVVYQKGLDYIRKLLKKYYI